jgi:hypothetical protein
MTIWCIKLRISLLDFGNFEKSMIQNHSNKVLQCGQIGVFFSIRLLQLGHFGLDNSAIKAIPTAPNNNAAAFCQKFPIPLLSCLKLKNIVDNVYFSG